MWLITRSICGWTLCVFIPQLPPHHSRLCNVWCWSSWFQSWNAPHWLCKRVWNDTMEPCPMSRCIIFDGRHHWVSFRPFELEPFYISGRNSPHRGLIVGDGVFIFWLCTVLAILTRHWEKKSQFLKKCTFSMTRNSQIHNKNFFVKNWGNLRTSPKFRKILFYFLEKHNLFLIFTLFWIVSYHNTPCWMFSTYIYRV